MNLGIIDTASECIRMLFNTLELSDSMASGPSRSAVSPEAAVALANS